MFNILTKIFLKLGETTFKNYMRNVFYGEVLSERIVEYPIVTMEIGKTLNNGDSIMDVGCYYSNLSLQLSSLGYKVTGIDLQNYELTHPNFKFLKGDVRKLKFKNKFDAITIISTIEHIGLGHYGEFKDPRGDIETLDVLKSHLKPTGKVFVTVPFGIASQTDSYRTYDWKGIQKLTNSYKIKKALFYKAEKKKWLPATRKEAQKIRNNERVNAVVFVLLEK